MELKVKKIGRASFYSIIFFLIGFNFLFSNIKATARLSDKIIGIGEQFTITISIENGSGKVNMPSMISNFTMRGSSQSKSMVFSGNQLVSTQIYYYTYLAKKAGEYEITPIYIKSQGKTYRANAITIKVIEGSVRNKDHSGNESLKDNIISLEYDEVYIENKINKKDVYLHEPIYITQTAYTRIPIKVLGASSIPSRENFISINDTTDYKTTRGVIENKTFSIKTLKKEILYPIKSGKKNIELTSFLLQTSGDVFTEQLEKGAEVVEINVRPLPKTKNKNFSGGVGEFDFNVEYSDREIKVGESVSIKIMVKGYGNTSIIEMPAINTNKLGNYFTIYPTKEYNTNWFDNDGKLIGEKHLEYLLLANESTDYLFDELEFNYFSPDTQSYKSIYSKPTLVSITGSKLKNIQNKIDDNTIYIMPISNKLEINEKRFDIFNSIYFYVYLISIVTITIFILIMVLIRKNARSKKSKENINYDFTLAEKYYNENDRENYLKEIINIITLKLEINENKNINMIIEAMKTKNINENNIKTMKTILDALMFEMYSGGHESTKKEDYHTKIKDIIKSID